MKLKHKACFIGIVAFIDLMVIILVVMTNNTTNVKEEISNKTAANVIVHKANEEVIEVTKDETAENVEVQDNNTNNSEEDDQSLSEDSEIQNQSTNIEKESTIENNDDSTSTTEIVEPVIVYDNMTLDQLGEKIDRSLNSTISGKGYLIASYSLEMGVDPYLATGIILLETGCTWECSSLVQSCNNVGGQKGSGCGSYKYYETLDEGIKGFIDNLYNNYYSYGLTTPEQMNSKYAESTEWASKVNSYIEKIKAA